MTAGFTGHIYTHIVKTTVEIPDSLFHRAKVFTAKQRITFRELIIASLEQTMALSAVTGSLPKLSAEQTEFLEIDAAGVPVLKRRKTPPRKKYLALIDGLREELGA